MEREKDNKWEEELLQDDDAKGSSSNNSREAIPVELGDMIQLSSDQARWNQRIFSVEYLDDRRMVLLDRMTGEAITLLIDEYDGIVGEDFDGWNILYRSLEKGYSRQRGLIPGVDIHIEFVDGTVMDGVVADLVEDMIEVTPKAAEQPSIFIDFGYKGLPEYILRIEPMPSSPPNKEKEASLENGDGEMTTDEQELREIYIEETDEEELVIYEEIQERDKKYGIDNQIAELVDQWLMSVPIRLRTPSMVEQVHRNIGKYKELRERVFSMDEHGWVKEKRPFKEYLEIKDLVSKNWVFPIIHPIKKIYFFPDDEPLESPPSDVILSSLADDLPEQNRIDVNEHWETNVPYENYVKRIHSNFSPFLPELPPPTTTWDHDVDMVIQNATVTNTAQTNKLNKTNFSVFPVLKQRIVTRDAVHIRGILTVPADLFRARIDTPTTRLAHRVHLSRLVPVDPTPTTTKEYSSAELAGLSLSSLMNDVLNQNRTNHRNCTIKELVDELESASIDIQDIRFLLWQELKVRNQIMCDSILKSRGKTRFQQQQLNAMVATTATRENAIIQTILQTEDREIRAAFIGYMNDYYRIDNAMTTGESLLRISALDQSELLSMMIQYLLYYLATPEQMVNSSSTPNIENETVEPRYTRHLAKHYTSEDALNRDRKKEMVYDADLDDTPYNWYREKYEPLQNQYNPIEFRNYLLQSLMDIEKVPDMERANEIVDAWLRGHKLVAPGDYAVVVDKKTKVFYQWSRDGSWVKIGDLDKDIIEELMDQYNRRGKPISAALPSPFEIKRSVMVTMEDMSRNLLRTIKTLLRTMTWKTTIEMENATRQRRLFNEHILPTTATPGVESPYIDLRQKILSEPDFPMRQYYIVRFFNKFCRDALKEENEQGHWGYCKETSVPLFPRSLYELAVSFSNGTYTETLNRLIGEIGVKSGDGDAIVDMHTNYVLKQLDRVVEDEYDENGFKIHTHSILETENALEGVETKTFEHPTAEKVFHVFRVLKQRLGLMDDNEEIEKMVMAQSMRILCQGDNCEPNTIFFMDRGQFKKEQKHLKELQDKGKQVRKEVAGFSYQHYMDRNIVVVAAAMFLVAVQTAVPSIRPKMTIPGCTYSYGGFPMSNDKNDVSGISFLSCFLVKYANQGDTAEIWKSIARPFQAERMTKLIVQVLGIVLEDDVVLLDAYKKKRQYLLLEQESPLKTIVANRWSTFLPPLVPFTVESKISREKFIAVTSTQTAEQLKSKNVTCGYGIVEKIQRIVDNSNDTSLLLPGVCCHETETHPLTFFATRDTFITADLKRIQQNDKLLMEMNQKYHSPFIGFHGHGSTSTVSTTGEKIWTDIKRETIYKAYIHYCGYDYNGKPDPEWSDLCAARPEQYKKEESWEQKIKRLEDAGIQYETPQQLRELLFRVNKKNRIAPFRKPQYKFLERLERLNQQNTENEYKYIAQPISELLNRMLHGSDDNELQRQWIDIIVNHTEPMLATIKDVLQSYKGKPSSSALDFLEQINKVEREPKSMYSFVKNSLYEMLKCFTNQVLYSQPIQRNVSRHWGFSSSHAERLKTKLNQYYNGLNAFLNPEQTPLKELLEVEEVSSLYSYIDWVDAIPELRKNGLNVVEEHFFLKYIWLSVLHKMIEIIQNMDSNNKTLLVEYLQNILFIQSLNYVPHHYTYNDIHNEVFKSREREKTNVIERIGNLNNEEQRVDKLMRHLKLGSYYVDPNFYKDPDFLEKRQQMEPMDNDNDYANTLYDEDYNDEDNYGEPRFDASDE